MNLRVNGIMREFDETSMTVTELLKILKYSFPNIIVRYKEYTVPKIQFDDTILYDKDEISIIHNMSGG